MYRLTVDRNSNALGQDVAIAAHERRDLAKLIQELVIVVYTNVLVWNGLDKVELYVVCVGDGE